MAREARCRGLATADAHREALAPVLEHRDQRDTVYLGRVALMLACGDRDFVLARQVRVLAIAVKKCRSLGNQRRHIENFVVIDARDRTSRDVAHDVAASAHRGEADAFELLENLGKLVERDVVQLDILARGQLALVAAVALGDLPDRPQPVGAQDAAGDFHPHHERADFRLVVIHAEPLQPHDIFLGEFLVRGLGQPVPLTSQLGGKQIVLEALDRVALQDHFPRLRLPFRH